MHGTRKKPRARDSYVRRSLQAKKENLKCQKIELSHLNKLKSIY
jgi:hypothetical protein